MECISTIKTIFLMCYISIKTCVLGNRKTERLTHVPKNIFHKYCSILHWLFLTYIIYMKKINKTLNYSDW